MDPQRAVAALAASQQGLVNRAQVLRRGISEFACDRNLRDGTWERVHRGVYRLPGAPETWKQAVMAACLAVPGAIASHRAAGGLHGLPGIKAAVEIAVFEYHRPLVGVTMHRATPLDGVDRDRVEGIPTTSLTRTVIDLAGVLDTGAVEALLDHVLAHRRAPLAYIEARLEAAGTRGRRGAATLARMLAERKGQKRFADSEPQRRLARLIRQARLGPVLYEHPIRLADGKVVYPDVFFPGRGPGRGLAVEVDSYLHHSTLTDWSRDHTRNAELIAMGVHVLPVTPRQISEDPGGVVELIARALAAS